MLSVVLFNTFRAALLLMVVGAVLWAVLKKIDPADRWGIRASMQLQARAAADWLRRAAMWVHARTLGRATRRWVRWSTRTAVRHLAWARRGFGQDEAWLFPRSHAVWSAVSSWYSSRPLAVIAYVVKAGVFLLITVNIGVIIAHLVTGTADLWEESERTAAPWWAPGGITGEPPATGAGSQRLNPLAILLAGLRRVGTAIADKASPYVSALTDPLGRPAEAIIGALGLVLTVMVLMALRLAWAALWHQPQSAKQVRGPYYVAPSPRFALFRSLLSLRVGANRRNRPVVALVNCLARVGAARNCHRWSQLNRIPLTAPRVHLADAEEVVWSAWRTRHTAIRGVLKAKHKEHAAEVVGALRAMEIRQDTEADRGQVFEKMAGMLAKIAERYAQGRTLALLDPEDLREGSKAINREWVRLVILGVAVVGSAVGASTLGASDAVIAQVVGIVSLIMVGLLYGSRLAPTDLMDVVRGQSRK
ncbi:hypothetical protein [Streptomyces sp. NBC_01602]|uniref:hypothetical protein n=1 Tax=Streptomyces sp. NBC_01602 TaxID=2975893 RepID=UPI0038652725